MFKYLSTLSLLFAAAKLLDLITWSWWLVFAPIGVAMIPLVFVVILLIVAFIGKLCGKL